MPNMFLDKIISGARRLAYRLKEKPKASLDDHAMEHMVFYHGLSGSSPDSGKEIRLVRADIKEAINEQNNQALSLALKLPPTMWQDRLQDIFSELNTDQKQIAISLLAPAAEHRESLRANPADFNSFAIAHSDWQTRANAANILAWLDAKETAPALAASIENDKLSFVYIAYALGKLQGEEAKNVLTKYLTDPDAWLRVDAAGALACFDFETCANLLANALLAEEESLDYMAYAISRQQKPIKFLQAKEDLLSKAAGCMIIGLIEAAENSFSPDLVFETESDRCLPILAQLIETNSDPILVDATWVLSEWLRTEKFHLYENHNARIINNAEIKKRVLNNLQTAVSDNSLRKAELIHTIRLAGRLKIKEAISLLVQLLTVSTRADKSRPYEMDNTDSNERAQGRPYEINYLIVALGELGDEAAAAPLIDCANKIVDLTVRCQLSKSKQPILEENVDESKTYWHILKALGNIPTKESITFLQQALDDYAPDKRARALTSLFSAYNKNRQLALVVPADEIFVQAMQDPSPIMQLAALQSASDFYINEKSVPANLIEEVSHLIDKQENTVSKQAISLLGTVYKTDKKIKAALQEKLKTIKEEYKRIAILDILQQAGND